MIWVKINYNWNWIYFWNWNITELRLQFRPSRRPPRPQRRLLSLNGRVGVELVGDASWIAECRRNEPTSNDAASEKATVRGSTGRLPVHTSSAVPSAADRLVTNLRRLTHSSDEDPPARSPVASHLPRSRTQSCGKGEACDSCFSKLHGLWVAAFYS